jgi:hypothetical protein
VRSVWERDVAAAGYDPGEALAALERDGWVTVRRTSVSLGMGPRPSGFRLSALALEQLGGGHDRE